MGFWVALEEVYGGTRQQRCWMHKTPSDADSGTRKRRQTIGLIGRWAARARLQARELLVRPDGKAQ